MTDSYRVLIIEDDPQTRRFLSSSLIRRGWRAIQAVDAKSGLALLTGEKPDLAILDLGLPDMDGIAATRRIRQLSELPILILSARSQEQNKIMALDAGADDYLTKPFGTGELHARLHALMRRVRRGNASLDIFETGQLRVDFPQHKVYVGDHEIRITPIEFRLLAILIRHAGVVVTHRQLLLEIWGPEHVQDQHSLKILETER